MNGKGRFAGAALAAAALLAAGEARAALAEFTLDPARSQVLVCETGGIFTFVPRLFLSGKATFDFQGNPAIPASGQAPIAVPKIDFQGTPDLGQIGNPLVVTSLRFLFPAVGVTETSSGFVEGVSPGTDALVVDQFAFSLAGNVSLDLSPPLPPLEFPIAEIFNEPTPGASAADFRGALTNLAEDADCALSGACKLSNDRPGNVPPLDQACNPTSFCEPGDFCLDVTLQNTPLGDVNARVKIVLVATKAAPPPSCAPVAP